MNDGAASIYALMLRVARLDSSGATPAGASNLYVSDALTKLTLTPVIEQGDEVTVKNGQGVVCVNYKAPDTFKRVDLELDLCTPDPELTELLAGGTILSDSSSALTTPAGAAAVGSGTGGVLAAATYSYRVSALNQNGETLAATAVTATTTGSTSKVTVTWSTVTGAYGYRVYGRVGGSETLLASVPNDGTLTYVDTGAAVPGIQTVPAVNTTAGPGTVGYAYPSALTNATPNGVSIEAWSLAVVNGAPAPSLPYRHWVIPRAFLSHQPTSLENAASTHAFVGHAIENPGWGNGPVNGWSAASSRVAQWRRVANLPTAALGYQATPAQV